MRETLYNVLDLSSPHTIPFSRTAVVQGLEGKPAKPRAAERAQSLLRQLNVVIRRAVQARLAQSLV